MQSALPAGPVADREERLLATLTLKGRAFHIFVVVLLAIIALGIAAYVTQLQDGLGVTGMRHYVFWGLYMTNFVFFIGISHAGTLISAILRVTGAGWRTPITRMAEAITAFAIMIGAPMVLIDMGRPERILSVFVYGRIQSAILWDVISITTYITGSLLYLYAPMIPDLAILRDRALAGTWRKKLYTVMALNWRGDDAQRHALERVISILAVLIIPIAVSVHTVVSWIFAMTLRPGWNSTIFGPYFVAGAIFGGIAALLVAMALFRKFFHLEEYITFRHFKNLSILFFVMDLIYIYLTFAEYLTSAYISKHPDAEVLTALLSGRYAVSFWGMVLIGFMLPAFMIVLPILVHGGKARKQVSVLERLRPALAVAIGLVFLGLGFAAAIQPAALSNLFGVGAAAPGAANLGQYLPWVALFLAPVIFAAFLPEMRKHPIATATLAGALVSVAMWLKRYLIIVPTLENPFIPIPSTAPADWAAYAPTWVEWSITAAAFATFILLYVLFARIFPIVSIWETREEAHAPHLPAQTEAVGAAVAPMPAGK